MTWTKNHFITAWVALFATAMVLTSLITHLSDLASETNELRKAKVAACSSYDMPEGAKALCIHSS